MFNFDFSVVASYAPMYFKGVITTVELTVLGIVFGLMLGLILAFMRLSKYTVVRWPALLYLNIFRGTPLFVQLLVVHYGLIPAIFGASQGAFFSGAVALALNSGAYVSEIFRAGIKSIDRGQMEAARSLGMSHWMAMREIILPQAIKRMIPPFGNEFIVLLKDSSLVAVIAVHDLTQAGRLVMAATLKPWEAYIPVALLYLLLTVPLTYLVAFLERRLESK